MSDRLKELVAKLLDTNAKKHLGLASLQKTDGVDTDHVDRMQQMGRVETAESSLADLRKDAEFVDE